MAVIAFIYNGTEGSVVAGPLANQALKLYYEIVKGEDMTLEGETLPDEDAPVDPDATPAPPGPLVEP